MIKEEGEKEKGKELKRKGRKAHIGDSRTEKSTHLTVKAAERNWKCQGRVGKIRAPPQPESSGPPLPMGLPQYPHIAGPPKKL